MVTRRFCDCCEARLIGNTIVSGAYHFMIRSFLTNRHEVDLCLSCLIMILQRKLEGRK